MILDVFAGCESVAEVDRHRMLAIAEAVAVRFSCADRL